MSIVPELKKVRELVKLAQFGPAASLPDETHQSLPIPLPPAGRSVTVAFLFLPSHAQRGVGLLLSAPSHRALIDAASGKVAEMKAVTPSELGVGDKVGKILGTFALPKGMSSEQYRVEQEHLYDAYDVLLPAWVAGLKAADAGSRVRSAAREFTRLFARVSEPPLAPYYRTVGRAFFTWVQGA
jgi:hypothetical protein